jgi:hypothetical protein
MPSILPGPYRHVSLPRTRTDMPCQLAPGTMARWSFFLPCLPVYGALSLSLWISAPCRPIKSSLLQGCRNHTAGHHTVAVPTPFSCQTFGSVSTCLGPALPLSLSLVASFRFCSFPPASLRDVRRRSGFRRPMNRLRSTAQCSSSLRLAPGQRQSTP